MTTFVCILRSVFFHEPILTTNLDTETDVHWHLNWRMSSRTIAVLIIGLRRIYYGKYVIKSLSVSDYTWEVSMSAKINSSAAISRVNV